MIELSEEEYDEVSNLHKQRYRPTRTRLARSPDPFERFQTKEFESGDVAELFHENTKSDPIEEREREAAGSHVDSAGFEYFLARAGSADYDERPLIELPDPPELSAELGEMLLGRRSVREFEPESVTTEQLSAVLRYGAGVSGSLRVDVTDGESLERAKRTYPSPGSLNPVELYVCVLDVEGLDDGLYFYAPREHGLRELDTSFDDFERTVQDSLAGDNDRTIETAGVHLVLAAAFWRAKAKYGSRGYRYVLQESGHVAQNVLLAAEAAELGGVPLAAFDDARTNDLLDLDGVNRAAIYSLTLGPTDE